MTTLFEIATRINARSRKATADVLATGRDLIEAKALCASNKRSFTRFMDEQCPWSHGHANRTMRVLCESRAGIADEERRLEASWF